MSLCFQFICLITLYVYELFPPREPHPGGGTQRHSDTATQRHWTFVDLLFIVTIARQTYCHIDPTLHPGNASGEPYQEPIILYNTISADDDGQNPAANAVCHREGWEHLTALPCHNINVRGCP